MTNVDWLPLDTFVVILGLGLDEWADSSNPNWRRTQTLSRFFIGAGVPVTQVLLLEDEYGHPDLMRRALPPFLAQSTEKSLLFFYYTGHGQTGTDCFHFCYQNSKNPVSDLELFITIEENFNGPRAVLFADCCFSGALVERAKNRKSDISYAVMASAMRAEESTGNWTFTDCLISALTGDAKVDWDGDGINTFSELVRHATQVMRDTEEQWMDYGFDCRFDVLFKLAKVNRSANQSGIKGATRELMHTIDANNPHQTPTFNSVNETASTNHRWWSFLNRAAEILADSEVARGIWTFDSSRQLKRNIVQIDYFISYRREGGGTIARLLHEVLKARGLVGFLDTESLGEGDYSAAIESNIEQARNFILIVAPNVFESKWVEREIQTALKLRSNDDQRRIIPLFTNGIVEFPNDLPNCIREITKCNAISLDHANFDEKLQELLSWLVTRHSMLVSACLTMWEQKDDGASEVFDAWRSVVGGQGAMKHLADKLRQTWQMDQSTTTTNSVLKSIGTKQLKSIARSLGIEHKGSRHALLTAFHSWLVSGGHVIPEDSAYIGQDKERYERVAEYLADLYRPRERVSQLKSIVLNLALVPENWRSSDSLVAALFDHPSFESVADIFGALGLTSEEMKRMGGKFLRLNSGSASANREAMARWVDYQDYGYI